MVAAMLNRHYLCVVLNELVQSAPPCSFADNANQITSQDGFVSAAICDGDGDDVVSS